MKSAYTAAVLTNCNGTRAKVVLTCLHLCFKASAFVSPMKHSRVVSTNEEEIRHINDVVVQERSE